MTTIQIALCLVAEIRIRSIFQMANATWGVPMIPARASPTAQNMG